MVVCGQLQGKHVRFYYHSFAFCNLSFIVYYDFVAREKTLIKHLCSIGPITITKKKKNLTKHQRLLFIGLWIPLFQTEAKVLAS
jgi:hypothetical protein